LHNYKEKISSKNKNNFSKEICEINFENKWKHWFNYIGHRYGNQ